MPRRALTEPRGKSESAEQADPANGHEPGRKSHGHQDGQQAAHGPGQLEAAFEAGERAASGERRHVTLHHRVEGQLARAGRQADAGGDENGDRPVPAPTDQAGTDAYDAHDDRGRRQHPFLGGVAAELGGQQGAGHVADLACPQCQPVPDEGGLVASEREDEQERHEARDCPQAGCGYGGELETAGR